MVNTVLFPFNKLREMDEPRDQVLSYPLAQVNPFTTFEWDSMYDLTPLEDVASVVNILTTEVDQSTFDSRKLVKVRGSPMRGKEREDPLVILPKVEKKKRKRSVGSKQLLDLYCHVCNTRQTPEWRRGPDGEHTLCNACGLHYAKDLKKEKERAFQRSLKKDHPCEE